MFKKIVIAPFVFFGMSLLVLYALEIGNEISGKQPSILKGEYEPVVVLELFTSQGCSSCPPADALLEKMKKQYPESVFALSYHVDYWNYIGWKDPFSKSVYTKKQTGYNRKFRNRNNYTPQMVVNGKEHFVGSNGSKLASKILDHKARKAENKVILNTNSTSNSKVHFNYEVKGSLKGRQLRAVLVLDERTTSVKQGENRNRALKNSNIVIAERYISLDDSKGKVSIAIPEGVAKNEGLTLILLVETDNLEITAAAKAPVKL